MRFVSMVMFILGAAGVIVVLPLEQLYKNTFCANIKFITVTEALACLILFKINVCYSNIDLCHAADCLSFGCLDFDILKFIVPLTEIL